MPYIVLLIGVLIGLYALYKFFLRANVAQIKALLFGLGTLSFCIALFFLAISGRLPAAIALTVGVIPVMAGLLRKKKQNAAAADTTVMDRAEALEILGISEDSDEKVIKAAYKKLIKKVHPDQDGSEWLAAKLNAARDFLLKEKSGH